jgi:hypothetical protein
MNFSPFFVALPVRTFLDAADTGLPAEFEIRAYRSLFDSSPLTLLLPVRKSPDDGAEEFGRLPTAAIGR